MEHNSDFKYDLRVGVESENELSSILKSSKIEVKRDLKSKLTGNVFIEYFCRGKSSGIANSQSDYYAIDLDGTFVIIPIEKLKLMCRKYLKTSRDVVGGDSNLSRGILLPIMDLII